MDPQTKAGWQEDEFREWEDLLGIFVALLAPSRTLTFAYSRDFLRGGVDLEGRSVGDGALPRKRSDVRGKGFSVKGLGVGAVVKFWLPAVDALKHFAPVRLKLFA